MTSTTDQGPERPAQRRAGPGQDLTTGPIGRTLILFALPVMGSNALQGLSGTVNAIWVSHALGETTLAATSNANNVMFLLLGAAFGLSMSANLMIAQAVGARDEALAKRVVGVATLFFLAVSIGLGVLGYLLTPSILAGMDTPMEVRAQAEAYLRVIFLALPFMYFFSFVMMAQRGAGDSRTPFWFALLSVVLDVGLNPVFIMGLGPAPRLGIAGSATATLIAQAFTLALMVVHLHRKGSVLALSAEDWRRVRLDPPIIRALVVKGLPMAFQMLVISGAALVMISFVNRYGAHTAAAYGAAVQLWGYVQMPCMALGAAVSSMAAQNVGAGRMDRVDKIARAGLVYALLFTAGPVVAVYAAEPLLLRMFMPATSPSMAVAMDINAHVLWGFIPFGLSFVLFSVVRATGAVAPPLIMMIISLWIVRIPFTVAVQGAMGVEAVWWSFPLGNLFSVAMAAAYYRWGGWRKARLLSKS